MRQLTCITRDKAVMGGKPCIGGMRGAVTGLAATGRTRDVILHECTYLEAADIAAALSYAAWRPQNVAQHLDRHA